MRGPSFCFSLFFFTLAGAPLTAAPLGGRVTDAAGQPVAGARVAWYGFQTPERRLLDRSRDVDPAPLGETKTDGNGRFVVAPGRSAGEISLRVLAAGLPSVEVTGPFDPSGDADELDVLVPAPQEFSGRVVDEAGKPLAGVRVRIAVDPAAAEGDGVAYDEATSTADGAFTVRSAPKDARRLTAWLAGFAPVSAHRNRDAGGQKIFLKRGGAIEGAVLDGAGRPAAGVVVVAAGAGGMSAAETGEHGRYRIAGVSDGLANVEALGKDDAVARRDGLRVHKGETARADLVLARGAAIAGTVVDEKTRRLLAGARISAAEALATDAPAGAAASATSDARGRFRLGGLVAREYHVVAARRDYMSSAMPNVLAKTSAPAPAAFALRRASTLTGHVQDGEGHPVAGARVSFVPGRGRREIETAWERRRAVTTTGANGTFRLRGMPPGPAVSIEATKQGFVPARRDGIAASGGNPGTITLVLRRGLRARGRVVDEAGQPVAGAQVRLTKSERYEGGAFASSTWDSRRPDSTTDAEGRFAAEALEEGEYTGRFTREGFASRRLPLEVRSDGASDWPPVVLRASAPIAGVVRDGKGKPIAGAEVMSVESRGSASNSSVTDADGRFRHDGYSEGAAVTFFISADGFARAQRGATAPTAGLTIMLSATGAIRGRVEDAETHSPIEAFSAEWYTPGPLSAGSQGDFRTPDGTFELDDVAPGKAEIVVSAPGYLETRLSGIEVGEGGIAEGVVLSLKKGTTVTGRVLDPSRAGVPNATVTWREEGTEDERGIFSGAGSAAAMIPNATTTDADGRFRYEGVPSGRLMFSAAHPDYLEGSRTLDTASDAALDIPLSAGGTIAGQVVGRDRRAPVEGAVVSLQLQGVSRSVWMGDEARSDPSGRFQFAHLREGRYRLAARSASGRSSSRDVVLAAGERVGDAFLELAGGALVRGRITGLSANDLILVSVFASSKDFRSTAPVSEDGQFLLRDVPPGILRLVAWGASPSGRSTAKTVEVPEGAAEIPVEIAFEAGSRLSGRVFRGEKGIPGLWISASTEGLGTFRGSTETDEDGRYRLDGLPDGTYSLSVFGSSPGFNTTRNVTVSGDTTADVVLRGVSVTGVVTDADSQEPLPAVAIGAQSTNSPSSAGVQSDSLGRYTFESLEEGTYQLTGRRPGYRQKTQEISVGDSPLEVNIALARGPGLVLRATDGLTGLPLASLSAFALSPEKALAFEGIVSLDTTGQGEISLAPGSYRLSLSAAGYASRVLQVSVPSPTLAVALTPGGRVEFRTETMQSCRILDGAGNPYFSPSSGADGVVRIAPPVTVWESLPAGAYVLVVKTPGADKPYPFTVAEGKTTTVELK